MNCHQVRAFIDGRPTPTFARPNPGEVRYHIDHCVACRDEARATQDLESGLSRLGSPSPTTSIASVVKARIAHTAPTAREAGNEAIPVVPEPASPGWRRLRDGVASIAMFVGIGVGAGAAASQALTSEPIRRLAESAFGAIDPAAFPESGSIDFLLGTGVLLYLVGLIGWSDERPRSAPRAFGTAGDRHRQ